jgi:hypothetical protein
MWRIISQRYSGYAHPFIFEEEWHTRRYLQRLTSNLWQFKFLGVCFWRIWLLCVKIDLIVRLHILILSCVLVEPKSCVFIFWHLRLFDSSSSR